VKKSLLVCLFLLAVSFVAKAEEAPWGFYLEVTPNGSHFNYSISEIGWSLTQNISDTIERSCDYDPKMQKITISTRRRQLVGAHVTTFRDVPSFLMDNHVVDNIIKGFPSYAAKTPDGKTTSIRMDKIIAEGDKSNKNYEDARLIYDLILEACR
jgi:hypothetical protein